MASAYKCDRCGELYPDETRARGVYLCDKDLCPKCQEQLDVWFADPNKVVVSYVEVKSSLILSNRPKGGSNV